jgi:protein SCO1/2
MTQILNSLPEDKLNKIQPLFITIDPERDTPELMKDYLSLFHPKIIGLTGTPEEIKKVIDLWRVYAVRVEDPDLSDYTMDHSTYTYLMDPDGTLVEIFRMKDSPQRMINTLNMRLAD